MTIRWILVGAVAAVIGLAPTARAQMAQDAARSIVKTHSYVSLHPVPRKRVFEVAVVAKIKQTYHINAHKVLDEFLIPTKIEGKLPAGFRLLSTSYPKGELKQFSFSKKKLAVYTGQMIVKMKLEALASASLGPHKLPLSLRYQACNGSMCLPPVTVPLNVHFSVAAAGAHAQPIHPKIFRHK